MKKSSARARVRRSLCALKSSPPSAEVASLKLTKSMIAVPQMNPAPTETPSTGVKPTESVGINISASSDVSR